MTQRLQKVLADAGVGSRRVIEGWIRAGRISVNGEPATLGQKVSGRERILVDGRPVRTLPERAAGSGGQQTLIYHKPSGQICSRRDPEGRPTIFDALPPLEGARWVNVGRLDFLTSGLIILTTDGELAHGLTHPSAEIEREYAVRVHGEATEAMIGRLLEGIQLDDGLARCRRVLPSGGDGSNHWYHVVVAEGRNRLVRRMFEACGLTVSRLIRIRYGPITLPRDLRAGRHRRLQPAETRALYALIGRGEEPVAGKRRRASRRQSNNKQ
jgi:23S rRNA pseudouridine2605 synthase